MVGLSAGLLRNGLALKSSQIKLAIRDYLHDRRILAETVAGAYVTAAALYAAAGVFLIAACLVGATALFRWIEIKYGMFWAFGAVGSLLVLTGATCVGIASSRLKRRNPRLPSLASRLRIAVISDPVTPSRLEAVTDAAKSILQAPSTPVTGRRRGREFPPSRDQHSNRAVLIMVATLLGWALARRLAARPDV